MSEVLSRGFLFQCLPLPACPVSSFCPALSVGSLKLPRHCHSGKLWGLSHVLKVGRSLSLVPASQVCSPRLAKTWEKKGKPHGTNTPMVLLSSYWLARDCPAGSPVWGLCRRSWRKKLKQVLPFPSFSSSSSFLPFCRFWGIERSGEK